MAATTEKRTGGSLLAGNSIFQSHQRFSSPMSQLRIPPQSNMNSTDDLPSPVDVPNQQDDIKTRAHLLARDYITHVVDGSSKAPTNDAEKILRRVGDEVMTRHRTVLNAMAKRLQFSDPDIQDRYSGLTLNQMKFKHIADGMAEDQQENWGRIVTLFVLASILALNDMKEGGGQDIDDIIETVGNYVGTCRRSWIEKNGGWDGFEKFFDKNSSEKETKVWKGLICAGLGLGAIMAVARQ